MDLERNIDALSLTLPDIARETRVELTGTLDRVGMTEIEIPVFVADAKGAIFRAPARAKAFVSLDDPQAKGIHMSRLFLELQEGLASGPLTFLLLEDLLKRFIETHRDLSESSSIAVSFDYMVERAALKSQNKGWRSYPMTLEATLEKGKLSFDLQMTITYSSTCPCSAALARKLIQDNFLKEFSGQDKISRSDIYDWLGSTQGILATPHSQRSLAVVTMRFASAAAASTPQEWQSLIDLVEGRLGTPVQAAVKREDEQEFALLNGQNLMFCEDAARKIKNALLQLAGVNDFRILVSHLESLHPHNAVSVVTKGVPGGFKA
jgi:GTP cyclohydrolase I